MPDNLTTSKSLGGRGKVYEPMKKHPRYTEEGTTRRRDQDRERKRTKRAVQTEDQRLAHNKRMREYRAANKDKIAASNRAYWSRQIEMIEKAKGDTCPVCGRSGLPPRALDMHHRDPETKVFAVSLFRQYNPSLEALAEEIAKCDPICATCHRIYHDNEG